MYGKVFSKRHMVSYIFVTILNNLPLTDSESGELINEIFTLNMIFSFFRSGWITVMEEISSKSANCRTW